VQHRRSQIRSTHGLLIIYLLIAICESNAPPTPNIQAATCRLKKRVWILPQDLSTIDGPTHDHNVSRPVAPLLPSIYLLTRIGMT
jgi:hypothetical protein